MKWIDVDFETRTLRITAEKGSNARIFKISSKLDEMLRGIPKEGERVFSRYRTLQNMRRSFERYRTRAAHKLGNLRLLQINLSHHTPLEGHYGILQDEVHTPRHESARA